MHLALVIYGDLNQTTGGYLYDHKMVTFLEAQGNSVDIVQLNDRGYFQNMLGDKSLDISQPFNCSDYDAVIIDELCHPSLLKSLPELSAKVCTLGLVHHLRLSEPQDHAHALVSGFLEYHFLENQHGLICNSETTRKACHQLLGRSLPTHIARPAAITQIHQFNEQKIIERSQQLGPLKILFLGTITRRKGLHRILEALKFVSSSVDLTVIGSPDRDRPYAAQCRALAESSQPHRIDFMGEVGPTTVQEKLMQSHLLAVPSDYEGFGIAYVEGFSAGLPCIATSRGAPPEFVSHGINGFLADPGNIQHIAIAIETVHADRRMLERMSHAALATHRTFPSWDETFIGLQSFIHEQVNQFRAKLA